MLVGLLAGFLPLSILTLMARAFESRYLKQKVLHQFKAYLNPSTPFHTAPGQVELLFDPKSGAVIPQHKPLGIQNIYTSYLLGKNDLSSLNPHHLNLQTVQYSYLGYCQVVSGVGRCLLVSRESLKDSVTALINQLVLLSLFAGIIVFRLVVWLGRQIVRPLEELTNALILSNQTPSNLNLRRDRDDEVGILVREIRTYLNKLNEYRMKEAVAEKNNALAQWAVQVAHDMRSPLSALSVLEKTHPGLVTERQILARNAIERMQQIADSLLKRSKDLNVAKEVEPVLLVALLQKLMAEKQLSLSASTKRINLNFKNGIDEVIANVDSVEFGRVISNLLNNAVESILDVGSVQVEVQQLGNEVFIQVSDTGCGIPEDILPKLTAKGSSYNKSNGTGLGLYHARSMIQKAWNGELELRSKVGEGTQVTIRLPVMARHQITVEEDASLSAPS